MSNTLVFDYAVSIKEAQSASKVDYSFLSNCLVLVKGNYTPPPPDLTGFTVDIDPTSQVIGSTAQASISTPVPDGAVLPTSGSWSVDDETIATIDSDGVLTAVAAGTAQVTYTDDDTSIAESSSLTVTATKSKKLSQNSAEVPKSELLEVKNTKSQQAKSKEVLDEITFTDPSDYKVIPIYEETSFENYTDNSEVPFFMVGGLNTVYLLIKSDEVDPADETAIKFDPTNYFTLCHSKDIDLEDAEAINFADFKGVTVYATSDSTKAEELSQTDVVFYDSNDSYAGAYEQFGYFLTQVYWRNNQYYVLDGDNPASTISELGEAGSLFDKRVSFYLDGTDGPTLGFFGCAGEAITKTYLNKLIQLETQEAITSYIQVNEPNDTAVQRINIEEAAMAVIEKYQGYPYFYLDADKNNYISILKSDEMYFVDGEAEIKIADPIWRAQIQVKEAQ
ncbi:Ig-like domain-containing protein [Vibrio algivorus]|uniref:BIG2 domain-containing protein n=1 Tax=Vibrio algivorus TaxID=1667024 RepID=A0A557P344_9VIBR|nr:Ig-like domain-containing protein [Vibrio algivorus]TVO35083.1 hypothetical protein FOF44_12330 [Vibrio algivorus]